MGGLILSLGSTGCFGFGLVNFVLARRGPPWEWNDLFHIFIIFLWYFFLAAEIEWYSLTRAR